MQRLLLHARPTWMLWCGLAVMLVVAIGAALSSVAVQRGHSQSLVIHTYLHVLDRVQLAMLEMETGQRGYLLTGEEPYLVPYRQGRQDIAAALNDLAGFEPASMGLSAAKLPTTRTGPRQGGGTRADG